MLRTRPITSGGIAFLVPDAHASFCPGDNLSKPHPRLWPVADPTGQPGNAVWHVDLATIPPPGTGDPAWLSLEETARAARFLRRADRDRFIRSHQALRYVLGLHLGRHPRDSAFRTGAHGKPELDDPAAGHLPFNLSHSANHALIGIGAAAIGVDVEAERPITDALAIARAHFHPGEVADLTRLSGSARLRAFFACWTRKEAVVKALGLGLSLPLDRFRVTLPPAEPAILTWEQASGSEVGWSMHHLDLGPDAVGAVAIARAGTPCARYRLPPNWADAT